MARTIQEITRDASARLGYGSEDEDDEEDDDNRSRFRDQGDDGDIVDYTSPQAMSARVRAIKPTHMYYRQPNGDIWVERTSKIERTNFIEEGWVPLPSYGAFDMAHTWSSNHPFETLFQFGGAKEMSVKQIMEMGFHFNPPLVVACGKAQTEKHNHNSDCYLGARRVMFPQLRGLQLEGPFPCSYCANHTLASLEALNQHMSVMHRDETSDLRTGTALATHLTAGLLKGLNVRSRGDFPLLDDDEDEDPEAPDAAEDLVAQGANAVLSVLQRVGLNKTQIAALEKAGMIEGFVEDPAPEPTPNNPVSPEEGVNDVT